LARACGFTVVAAGRGRNTSRVPHLDAGHGVELLRLHPRTSGAGDFNAKMFNSFLDGTKSAIEMAAVANATGLVPPKGGSAFRPAGLTIFPASSNPAPAGGVLDASGQVEVVSSLERTGGPYTATCAGGSMSPSPPTIPTPPAVSASMASSPTRAAGTRPSTGRPT